MPRSGDNDFDFDDDPDNDGDPEEEQDDESEGYDVFERDFLDEIMEEYEELQDLLDDFPELDYIDEGLQPDDDVYKEISGG